ncbi:MAG: hypothetical protein HUU55_15605 [Myxococcales bacterium]|nr:hypothetical protein [Myxococcales bacterium]
MNISKKFSYFMPVLSLVFLVVGCDSNDSEPESDTHENNNEIIDLSWSAVANDYEPGALLSIWSNGGDDVWTVGGEAGKPLVLHYDGTTWEKMDPGVGQQLWWVHGFKNGPVFVVGDGGAIARYVNGTWEIMNDVSLPGTTLYGVWGSAPDDVWAVGGVFKTPVGGAEPEGDVVIHYDGQSWKRVSVPYLESKPASAAKNLFKVWGVSSKDVFIVGDSGLALHYDGSSWRKEDTGVTGVPLFTVSGRSADDVYAIGGFSGPVLVHWDGNVWTELEVPDEAPQIMQGIWTAPNHSVYISGHSGFTARLDKNGTWELGPQFTEYGLHAVWGDGAGGLWAAGGDIATFQTDYTGIVAIAGRTVPPVP